MGHFYSLNTTLCENAPLDCWVIIATHAIHETESFHWHIWLWLEPRVFIGRGYITFDISKLHDAGRYY